MDFLFGEQSSNRWFVTPSAQSQSSPTSITDMSQFLIEIAHGLRSLNSLLVFLWKSLRIWYPCFLTIRTCLSVELSLLLIKNPFLPPNVTSILFLESNYDMTLPSHLLKDGDDNQIWNERFVYEFKEYDLKGRIIKWIMQYGCSDLLGWKPGKPQINLNHSD